MIFECLYGSIALESLANIPTYYYALLINELSLISLTDEFISYFLAAWSDLSFSELALEFGDWYLLGRDNVFCICYYFI